MSKKYKGGCKCGAVKVSFEGEEIVKGLRWNCSICSRKEALMNPQAVATEDFDIEVEEGALGLYHFGAKTAIHCFCNR